MTYTYEVALLWPEGQEQRFTVTTTAGNRRAALDQIRALIDYRANDCAVQFQLTDEVEE